MYCHRTLTAVVTACPTDCRCLGDVPVLTDYPEASHVILWERRDFFIPEDIDYPQLHSSLSPLSQLTRSILYI